MAAGQAMRNCVENWAVLLVGIVGTALLVVWSYSPAPVFYSQADVVLLAPMSRDNPNALTISTESLVSTAGIIQREFDGANFMAKTSSASIALYDQGLYDDTRVKVPDTGGQWEHNFARPVLDVQVTGSDPQVVLQRMVNVQQEIRTLLDVREEAAGVARRNRIQVQAAPAVPSVSEVSGDRRRAATVSLLLGLGLTVALCSAAAAIRRKARRAVQEQP